ncbi:hypothetical protein [Deinococcus aquaedulcis]|uniref:hypothetical protein n=1 Tax=Deinococcus aquaedulcis TaxID=2840455 RepID=UPI001C8302A7|nr:hypothetical protein [Deinococcus aquaedulcis]
MFKRMPWLLIAVPLLAGGAPAQGYVPTTFSTGEKVALACAWAGERYRAQTFSNFQLSCFDPKLETLKVLKDDHIKVNPADYSATILALDQGMTTLVRSSGGAWEIRRGRRAGQDAGGFLMPAGLEGNVSPADREAIAWAKTCFTALLLHHRQTYDFNAFRAGTTCQDRALKLVPEAYAPLKKAARLSLITEVWTAKTAGGDLSTTVNVQSSTGRWFTVNLSLPDRASPLTAVPKLSVGRTPKKP